MYLLWQDAGADSEDLVGAGIFVSLQIFFF